MSNAYCLNDEDRKDLIQEIIIQIWKSFHRYNDRYQMSTWIYRIALNVAISWYRKDKSRQDKLVPMAKNIIQLRNEDETSETENEIRLLYKFINELKELDRALMILYLETKSYREIAEILGISESNVATKVSRIKLQLKEKFTQHNN